MREANITYLVPRLCHKLQMMSALPQSPVEHIHWTIKLRDATIMTLIKFMRIR